MGSRSSAKLGTIGCSSRSYEVCNTAAKVMNRGRENKKEGVGSSPWRWPIMPFFWPPCSYLFPNFPCSCCSHVNSRSSALWGSLAVKDMEIAIAGKPCQALLLRLFWLCPLRNREMSLRVFLEILSHACSCMHMCIIYTLCTVQVYSYNCNDIMSFCRREWEWMCVCVFPIYSQMFQYVSYNVYQKKGSAVERERERLSASQQVGNISSTVSSESRIKRGVIMNLATGRWGHRLTSNAFRSKVETRPPSSSSVSKPLTKALQLRQKCMSP